MRQPIYTPVTQMEKLTESAFATGQKDYTHARQRAAQFNSPVSAAASIKAVCIAQAVPKDFTATTIIHYGVHHAKK